MHVHVDMASVNMLIAVSTQYLAQCHATVSMINSTANNFLNSCQGDACYPAIHSQGYLLFIICFHILLAYTVCLKFV